MTTAAPESPAAPATEIVKIAERHGLAEPIARSLVERLVPIVADAGKAAAEADGLTVNDASDLTGMAKARTIRLKLRELRIAAEKVRKAEKADALNRGRAIDAIAGYVESLIAPVEQRMLEQEEFAVRMELERKARLKAERAEALYPFGVDAAIYGDLGGMPAAQWDAVLAGAKAAHEALLAAQEKDRAASAAVEKTRQEELALERTENERLRVEGAERERLAKIERDRVDAERRAERERLEVAMKAEREKTAAAQREADDRARKERDARVKAEAELKAKKDADAKKARDEARARAKAARAPDAERVRLLAVALRSVPLPTMVTRDGGEVLKQAKALIDHAAGTIEAGAAGLSD